MPPYIKGLAYMNVCKLLKICIIGTDKGLVIEIVSELTEYYGRKEVEKVPCIYGNVCPVYPMKAGLASPELSAIFNIVYYD